MAKKNFTNAGDMFWTWSLSAYANPTVRSLCLRLQDDYGYDVNIILWVCWLAEQSMSPTNQAVLIVQDIEGDREARVLKGLRKARREINFAGFDTAASSAKPLKDALLSAELVLEKKRQYALADLRAESGSTCSARELARFNFAVLHVVSAREMKATQIFDHLISEIFT